MTSKEFEQELNHKLAHFVGDKNELEFMVNKHLKEAKEENSYVEKLKLMDKAYECELKLVELHMEYAKYLMDWQKEIRKEV